MAARYPQQFAGNQGNFQVNNMNMQHMKKVQGNGQDVDNRAQTVFFAMPQQAQQQAAIGGYAPQANPQMMPDQRVLMYMNQQMMNNNNVNQNNGANGNFFVLNNNNNNNNNVNMNKNFVNPQGGMYVNNNNNMVYNQAPQQFVNPGSVVNPNVANVNLTPAKTGRVYLEDDYGLLPVIRFSNDGNNNNSNANATAAQKEEGNFIYLIKGFHLNTLGFRNKLQGRDNLCSTTATLFLDDEGDILHHDMEQQQQNNEKYNFNLGTKKYYVLPDYKMSETYKKPKPKELSMKTFSLFKEETLFYVFYSMPRDVLHLAAAKTLYERRWKYHKRFQFWFQLPDGNEAQYMHADYEGKGPAYMAPFRLFNPNTWKVITTEANYVILLSDLEEESVLKEAMERAAIKSRERQQQQQQQQKQ